MEYITLISEWKYVYSMLVVAVQLQNEFNLSYVDFFGQYDPFNLFVYDLLNGMVLSIVFSC